MHGFIAITDFDWMRHLRAQGVALEEANFWKPGGRAEFKSIAEGEPIFFKLKKKHGDVIAGFGQFRRFVRLPARTAWDYFGAANGVGSWEEMHARIAHYRHRIRGEDIDVYADIGCVLVAAPVLFPPDLWIAGPSFWKKNTVVGQRVDVTEGERGAGLIGHAPIAASA